MLRVSVKMVVLPSPAARGCISPMCPLGPEPVKCLNWNCSCTGLFQALGRNGELSKARLDSGHWQLSSLFLVLAL